MSESLTFKKSMAFTYGVASEMAPGIRRLVARNPGPFTFMGTNTYLVGEDELAIIDPGPDDPDHFDAILRAVAGRPVRYILVTHTHRDHVDLLPRLVEATGARTAGFGRARGSRPPSLQSPSEGEFVDYGFEPDLALRHGDRVQGSGWALDALHTPGHAPDHLCFALAGGEILFSGDHIMAWNTSVVAPPEGRMADYMASLDLLLARDSEALYLPGHGGRLEQPRRMVRAYLVHRQWREQAILAAIRDGRSTIPEIVSLVYRGIAADLAKAASLSVLAHVEHLVERGLVTCDGPPSLDRQLAPA